MRFTGLALIATSIVLAAAPASASVVVLTFDNATTCVPANNLGAQPGSCILFPTVSPTYGSTAELGVSYRNYGTGGILISNTLTGKANGASFVSASGNAGVEDTDFIFTPSAGFEVSLASFETFRAPPGLDSFTGLFALFDPTQATIASGTFDVPSNVDGFNAPNRATTIVNSAYFSGPIRLRASTLTATDYDNITLNVRAIASAGAVPEPASWAMMIMGFGLTGGLLRRRRMAVA